MYTLRSILPQLADMLGHAGVADASWAEKVEPFIASYFCGCTTNSLHLQNVLAALAVLLPSILSILENMIALVNIMKIIETNSFCHCHACYLHMLAFTNSCLAASSTAFEVSLTAVATACFFKQE